MSSLGEGARVEVAHHGRWEPVDVELVGHADGIVDVSVLAPQVLFGAAHPLEAKASHVTFAEDVYFLGVPYGLTFDPGNLNAGFPFPLVKKGIVSALDLKDGHILLDGHNNPGFSGGPVVRIGKSSEPIVIGLVSAYRFDRQAVLDPDGLPAPFTYDLNTGIVSVYDARHIHKLVSKNPIGIALR